MITKRLCVCCNKYYPIEEFYSSNVCIDCTKKAYPLKDFDQPNNKGWIYDLEENKVYTKFYKAEKVVTIDSGYGLLKLDLSNAKALAEYLLSYIKGAGG